MKAKTSIEPITVYYPVEERAGYALPFEREPIITQGFCSSYSHQAFVRTIEGFGSIINDDRYSVDFYIEPDTPLLAPKAGIVSMVVQNLTDAYYESDIEKGINRFPNFVVLDIEDGTKLFLAHFAPEGVHVQQGEEVRQGQELGVSGPTGWVGSFPHVHVEAFAEKHQGRRSFPIIFHNYQGSLYHQDIDQDRLATLDTYTIEGMLISSQA